MGALILIAIGAVAFLAHRPVTIRAGSQVWTVDTRALTVGWALRDAGIVLSDQDEVSPAIDERLPWQGASVTILSPRPVSVWRENELVKTWWTTERSPETLLEQAGVTLGSGDQLLWNGAPLASGTQLPGLDGGRAAGAHGSKRDHPERNPGKNGEHQRAYPGPGAVERRGDGHAAGYALDRLQYPAGSIPRNDDPTGGALPGRGGWQGSRRALGRNTVGQALAEAGVALQGLDYAVPAEDQPLPLDGRLRVVRVREDIELQQTALPFKNEFVPDPTVELDQTRIVQAGQPGAQVKRVRIRYEDGKEVSREAEAEWLASPPINQKTGYGTQVVIRTLDTPDGPIEYYRKVTVYATSFAPCNFIQFIGKCSYTTAAGYPLQKGVIGVGEAWYRLMKGWGVYVDGYGPARVGDYGYVPGFWIDLGFSDADFVNWHRNTTLYFLTPVPANVPWTLPK